MALEDNIVKLSLAGWSHVPSDPAVCACKTTKEGNIFLAETTDTPGNAVTHTAENL